ncbi:maleylpyruvate isomerase N-terminal domain-containing protein [Kineococcus sp. SYSU DK006]|uniref:maleylpyruvate isomerase N-terminal domain-containing protein n=1 Tax=Kineococcus sp. SYSU DK006 TaxID=3383127 RepID=UPI003D7C5266
MTTVDAPGDTAAHEGAVRAFAAAADWFVATTALVGGRWEEPGLGEWDVRALVGHTSRSLSTVESYLAAPAGAVEVATTAGYYRATSALAAGPGVAQRGRDAGAALGADPAAAVAQLAARVVPLVAARSGEELLTTVVGGMRLRDYLPTRTFELVVHTADLASALGEPAEPPAPAAAAALELVAALALDTGRAGRLLLAATGRTLPGLTVL